VMSIPRDTLVKVNGNYNRVRFNSLYEGLPPNELIEGVKSLLGLEVDRWVKVDFDAFVGIVDVLGGIEINVDKRMWYVDNAGGYSLDLQPGKQVLDGETALAYVRFRQDALGDISRVSRQQEFVQAIAKAAVRFGTLTKLGEFKAILDKYVQNDLNMYEYAAIGIRMLKIGPGNIQGKTLPGHFSGPYWEADEEAVMKLLQDIEGGGTR
jgi:LCP family protein required for cell wall assembly